MLICGILCGFFIFFSRMIFYLFWRKKDKLNIFWRKKRCIMIRRSRLCWVWSSRQCEFLFFACDSSCLWSRKLCVRKLITRIINNTLINKNMFRIGELDDTIHSTLSSSSMGLLDSNSDAMSIKKEKSEIDFFQEASVFGSFDPDDPDFSAPYSSGHNLGNCNSSNNLFNWTTNRLSNHGNSLSSRPSSRHSLGRNSSSNSLKRTKSTNSMSCSRFYIGI